MKTKPAFADIVRTVEQQLAKLATTKKLPYGCQLSAIRRDWVNLRRRVERGRVLRVRSRALAAELDDFCTVTQGLCISLGLADSVPTWRKSAGAGRGVYLARLFPALRRHERELDDLLGRIGRKRVRDYRRVHARWRVCVRDLARCDVQDERRARELARFLVGLDGVSG